MRAYYFTEMPYPYYPPEVAQQLHSQRVILPNLYCDPKLAGELYNRYLDEYEYADELGLDIMLNEHHQTVTCIDSVMPLTAAALARRTQAGQAVIVGQSHRQPRQPGAGGRRDGLPRLCDAGAPHLRLCPRCGDRVSPGQHQSG